MEFLLLSFVSAWVLRYVWEGKVDDLNGSQKARQKQINQAHPNWSKDRRQRAVTNGARRNAAGWVAYQLRHGWIPAFGDVADGYRAAKIGHAEWLAQRPEAGQGGFWKRLKTATKAGWTLAKVKAASKRAETDSAPEPPPPPAREPAPAEYPKPKLIRGATTSRASKETDPETDIPLKQVHDIPVYQAPPQNKAKENDMSGETGGYAGAQQLTDGYQQSLTAAQSQLEQYEADLIAGGLAKDPQALATLAAAREGLSTAQAAFGTHKNALTSHAQGAEYAQSKGAAAATTEWLGDGA